MRVIRGFDNLPDIIFPIVAVGSFDGVHSGHRLLIGELVSLARESGGESVVVTFDPHPRQLLRGENRLLTTIDEKLTLMAQTPLDNVIVVNFTHEFSRLNHQEFLEDYIMGRLGAHTLISGQGHHFGHNRGGSAALVRESGVGTIEISRYNNISSTLIRELIEVGRMDQAADLLGGGGYLVELPLSEQSKLLPPDGQYRVITESGDQQIMRIDRAMLAGMNQSIRIMSEMV